MRTRRRRDSAADPEWLSERAREVGGLFGDALRIMGRRALRAQLELLEGVVEVTEHTIAWIEQETGVVAEDARGAVPSGSNDEVSADAADGGNPQPGDSADGEVLRTPGSWPGR